MEFTKGCYPRYGYYRCMESIVGVQIHVIDREMQIMQGQIEAFMAASN